MAKQNKRTMEKENDISRIWKLLFQTTEVLRNMHARTVANTPLPEVTISQMRVMSCIFFSSTGSAKIKDIAAELGITSGGVSQIVDNLVKYGLVERRIDETDRRAVSISLSPEGQRCRVEVSGTFTQIAGRMLESVSPNKLSTLVEVLETMLKVAEKEKEKEKEKQPEEKD